MFRRIKFNYDRFININLGDISMKQIHEDHIFLNAFKYAAIGMAIVSTEGKWFKVNPSLCRILGYSMEEFEQMSFQDMTHPDDLRLDLQSAKKLLDGEVSFYEIEKRYIHKTGDIVWGHLSVSLVKDDKDRPSYFISQIQDITKQKELSVKLTDSEERYRKWVRNSPEPMAIHDAGTLLFINNEGVKLIGANSYHDLLGHQVLDYIHDDYKGTVSERIQYMMNTNQQPEPYNVKLIDLLGNDIDVRLSSVPLEYQGKKVIQVFFSNITQRKQIEEAIRKSEAKYKSLFELYPEGLFVHGKETLKAINEKFIKLIGASSMEEVLQKSLIHYIHKDDHKKVNENINILKQYKTSVPISEEVRCVRLDGTSFIGELSIIKMKYEQECAILGVLRDVTKQREAEHTLKEMNARLEEISKMDGLTAIPNRRSFDEVLQAEWQSASQNSTPISLIMLDIDHFKAYNDTYGHHGGDECLKTLAQTLKKSIQYNKDFAARYGGEEFAIILPETDEENAFIVAERLHSMIEDLKIPHIGSKVSQYVTISLGVSTLIPTPQLKAQELLVEADRALYNSKATGRNRISVYAK